MQQRAQDQHRARGWTRAGRSSPPPVIDPTGATRLRLLIDARTTYRHGPSALAARQQERLAELVAFARDRSPFYHQLYAGLPQRVTDPTQLPVTTKSELMSHFEEVLTDRRITRESVEAFVADPARIGHDYLGAYSVASTSGTTGRRGLFLLDQGTLRVAQTIVVRMLGSWLNARDLVRIAARGARMAMVFATGGHYASAVAAAKLASTQRGSRRVRVFGVHTPLPELVAGLNAFRPAVLTPYATTGVLLAAEQQAGRLHIQPALVTLSAEGIDPAQQQRIASVFGAKVGNSYAATECPFLSYSCPAGWLHLNSDWAILEPVEADYRPTSPGQLSHTVLVTNLANRVQPILRYDLGDRVLMQPHPCPCGSPLPGLRVQGRTADLLRFPTPDGTEVRITSLTLSALLDRLPTLELAQLVQTAPTTVRVRLRPAPGITPDQAWEQVAAELEHLFRTHQVDLTLERAEEAPAPSPGGKYRLVHPLPSVD
ncbi:putative adenylate-forming enzyme [Kocuria rosea]|nr:putative adenylate-forming enzyme [Kocuria rosea]